MPGFYVFPGGRVGAEDKFHLGAEPLKTHEDHASWLALMCAAIRETYEETGLLLGHPDLHAGNRPMRTALEGAYRAQGLRPAIDALKYIGRAITPRQSPMRFNTRFFSADGVLAHGALTGNGELDDLGWRTLEECRSLPMADVTRFMLERAATGSGERDDVIYHYVRGVPRLRREAPPGARRRVR
jgi:8-oxo-dGTP pyrophosphatase MutT (NUDIX family)